MIATTVIDNFGIYGLRYDSSLINNYSITHFSDNKSCKYSVLQNRIDVNNQCGESPFGYKLLENSVLNFS